MPGPGGGAHGGGGARGGGGGFGGGSHGGGGGFHGGAPGGGFHGGGHHGGGFHGGGMPPGGHHRPPHHGGWHGPHFGGWFGRPRHYGYGGGGCLGSIAGSIIAVVVIIVAAFSLFGSAFGGISFSNTNQYETEELIAVDYDENTFQDYTNTQYKKEFGSSEAYEDNILLVFLADAENCYDYYYIAWVGDHIVTDINYMFGDEYTEFGQAISEAINSTSYKYSLDSNIADVIKEMESQIMALNLETSFSCEETHGNIQSHLTNKTSLDMTEDTVNTALQSFTEATGIPIVVVVDDIDDVFPTNSAAQSVQNSTTSFSGVTILLIIILIAIAAAVIVYIVRRKKKNDADLESDD